MARGWESKAVEAQQEAASETRVTRQVTPEGAERARQRATLMLARTKALSDLQAACRPMHRAMLEQSIAEIDRLLADLG